MFKSKPNIESYINLFEPKLQEYQKSSRLFESVNVVDSATYLISVLLFKIDTPISQKSIGLKKEFDSYIRKNRLESQWKSATSAFDKTSFKRFEVIHTWVSVYLKEALPAELSLKAKALVFEMAYLCFDDSIRGTSAIDVETEFEVNDCVGSHVNIVEGLIGLNYRDYISY